MKPSCGDYGGLAATGKPCRRRVGGPGRRCPSHPRDGDNRPRRVTLPDGSTAFLDDDVGRVTIVNGQPNVCELGLAFRLGLADLDAATAAGIYPGFELCPGEERPEPGAAVAGVAVFCWVTQEHAAQLMEMSPRHLQNLERKGLPHEGHRGSKRYPLPHLLVWSDDYKSQIARYGRCSELPFEEAWERHLFEQAEVASR